MGWLNENGTRDQSEQITTRLLGVHNIQNILLGAAVARLLGVRLKTIAVAAASMEPVEHRLELKQREGLTVIDDAFSSNPVGAKRDRKSTRLNSSHVASSYAVFCLK